MKTRKNEQKETVKEIPVYTLRIVSQLSGVPAHSIRQYIDKGLLLPFKLGSSRHLFSQGDITRLRNINLLIQEKGLNFAGIRTMMSMLPCWRLKQCGKENQAECSAAYDAFKPCWESSQKGRICRNENCRECVVYRSMDDPFELKSALSSF